MSEPAESPAPRKPERTWLGRVFWTPPWLRWDPDANHDLTWSLNMLFGFAGAFGVANLYYNHPILNVLADDFGVSDERASLVPTILQAGYAGGLLLVIPVGDIVRRRPMALTLIFITALIWLGLTLTNSYAVFLGLSFIVGMLTVTPQLMFPLAAQYAPPRHKATMISVVMSGVVFGILVARLLSGIITQYSSWRSVYWMSFGLQVVIFVLLFLMMPDYPVIRPGGSYHRALLKIVTLPFQHPVLVQISLTAFLTSAMFMSFWTTLTFQLAGPPFSMSSLAIGLFALIGLAPMVLNPLVSWGLTRRIHPLGSLIIAELMILAVVCIGTFIGTFSLAGPILWAFLGDLGFQASVVANRMSISNVDATAHNSVNSVYMVFTFCGQLFGTAVGNNLYARGGWIHSGALGIATTGACLIVILIRGPHETGWVGWGGGWDLRNKTVEEDILSGPEGDMEKNAREIESEPVVAIDSDVMVESETDTHKGVTS